MIDNRKVGQAIANYRREKSMTQQDLAAYLEVSHQAVSKWENGAALPDVLTLMKLSRLFGVTLEQLLEGTSPDDGASEPEQAEPVRQEAERSDNLNFDKIIAMAPFMSKKGLSDIISQCGDKCTPRQLMMLAPFLSGECLESLIANCESEITWDTLRRLAPFLKKEAVDGLTLAVAKGEKYMRSTFDAMRKTYGEVDKSISRVIKKLTKSSRQETASPEEPQNAVDRAAVARSRIFERALAEEKFDWIAAHLEQLDDDGMKNRIARRARELGMTGWLNEHMSAFQDAEALNEALLNGDWERVSEHLDTADEGELVMVAETALTENRWDWISGHMDDLLASEDIRTAIAKAALDAGKLDLLGAYLEELRLDGEQLALAAQTACDSGRWDWAEAQIDALGGSEKAAGIVLNAALREDRMDFIGNHLDELCLNDAQRSILMDYLRAKGEWDWMEEHLDEIYPAEYDGFALAKEAYLADHKDLAQEISEDYDIYGEMMEFALDQNDADFAALILENMRANVAGEVCVKAARNGHLLQVVPLAEHLNRNAVSELLEIATENGDWAIIEQLYDYLD